MKYIVKQNSPIAFENWKNKANLKEWGINNKQVIHSLKESLLDEQGHICCYCGVRIFNDHNTIFEHLYPRNKKLPYRNKMYDYNNILASCIGGQKDIIHIVKANEKWNDIVSKFNTEIRELYELN